MNFGNGIRLIEGSFSSLEQYYLKVFSDFDAFSPNVCDGLQKRIVIFPTDSYHLSETQFCALSRAINEVDDGSFFISELGWREDSFHKGRHYRCHRPSFDMYTALPIGVENAIYGKNGLWGVVISDELHAILACNNSFFEVFRQGYPAFDDDLRQFGEYWKEVEQRGISIDWFDSFCSRLSYDA